MLFNLETVKVFKRVAVGVWVIKGDMDTVQRYSNI